MFELDERILRAYFRMEEAQRQRLWLARLIHPEEFDWKKRGTPPPITHTKEVRIQELSVLGFGELHYQAMVQAESMAKTELETLAQEHPLWPHMSRIKGFGPYIVGAFIAVGGDIQRCPTVSSFWRGMGLDVLSNGLHDAEGKEILPPGSVPRRIRGSVNVERKVPALPHVTKVGEQIRQQILRSGGNLYELYARFREQEPPGKVKMFAFKSALRKTQKVLYSCCWEEWRKGYGLPAPKPYAFALLKHDDSNRITFEDLYDRELGKLSQMGNSEAV